MEKEKDVLSIVIIALLIVISATGVLSSDFSKSYEVANQYGDMVKMYGNGIYAHDSYFAAPIFIGTDFMILFIFVPLFLYTYFQNAKGSNNSTKLKLMSVYSVAFYYAASLSFGVTYNRYHLLYIGLFTCTLFGLFSIMRKIKSEELNYNPKKGIKVFLILTGVALIVAWMPEIIQTVISNTSHPLIEVYTTSVTNVLDIGIIGPLCLVCLHLLKKKDKLGIIILASLLKACIIVGIMMITQTIFQILSGYEATLPMLITKAGSFLLLGGFALYFNSMLYRNLTPTMAPVAKALES
ncbi:MAG TPA: hypothetical protein DDZ70_03060 [Firmicutes bacterium]|jgi:hypothetical protein|nr:hypothetical protein [Bacillota bacterium]